jgi:hypothetical protein
LRREVKAEAEWMLCPQAAVEQEANRSCHCSQAK